MFIIWYNYFEMEANNKWKNNNIFYFPNPKFIKENGGEINLKEELNNNSISIDDIISLMDLYTTANDGGSKIY